MSLIKKSITVTDSQDAFIQGQVASGRYATDSEVIRDALREKELRMAEIDALRAKLAASEASGRSERSPSDIRAAAKERLKSSVSRNWHSALLESRIRTSTTFTPKASQHGAKRGRTATMTAC